MKTSGIEKAVRHVGVAVLLATLLVSTIGPAAVHAAGSYVVNSIADDDDATAGDGLCKTILNECTLRAAIQQANADASAVNTTISFTIPGAGVHTITTTRSPDALPVVLVPITIDGTTQPGWGAATAAAPATLVIEIDCRSSTFYCIQLRGATGVVKGLTINHAGTAITVGNSLSPPTTVVNSVITGNHLGTNPAGTATSPPLSTDPNINMRGIQIGNGTATIGGVTPADRNVISGFQSFGILTEPTVGAVTVQGNYIGTNATGTAGISPFGPPGTTASTGLIIQSAGTIGGSSATMRNIISGWPNRGIIVGSGNIAGPPLSLAVTIQGNYIGTDVTGTAKVPNLWGVAVSDANNVLVTGNVISGNQEVGVMAFVRPSSHPTVKGNIIGPQKDGVTAIPASPQQVGVYVLKGSAQVGGTTAGEGNIIAYNNDPTGGAGVYVVAGNSGTTVLGNSIFSNSLSLTGSGDGITLEPTANNNQAAPTITSAMTASGTTTITGTFNSAANTTYRLEFFANTALDAPGISEGETFLGSLPITTDGSGGATINTTAFSIPGGKYVTATATDTVAGNTSQFSNALLVSSINQQPTFTKGPDQTVNENAGAQTVNPWATAISAGAGDSGQTVTFQVTNNTNAALFSAGPAVSPTGVLTYTPATNQFGTATITLVLKDNGGTANGGVDTSAPQSFTITVNNVNQQPTFTKGPDQTVNENAGAQTVNPWATAISAGPGDAGQTLTFQVTNNTNAALFSAGPAVSPTGVLTYTPATNVSGNATITLVLKDNGGTANGGVDTSAPQTFTITVNNVNQQPTFAKGPDQTVFINAGAQTVNPWATAISAGPNEGGQTLTFQVMNNTNAALFSAGPAVSPTGALTYTPAANATGSATITLVLKDNGGTANGGVDTSAPQTFTITVNNVNQQPTFAKGPDQMVLEDVGAQTVNPWATAISAGAGDSGQTVTFQVTNNTNVALFSVSPVVDPTGTLTYTPAANVSGSATITLVLKDNGGTANGGVDTSAPQTFTITVTAVNDVPSFTKGPDQTVAVNAPAQSVLNWATNISPGPSNESGQSVTFNVTNNTNTALFSVPPAVSSTGTLTYTPASGAVGSATITLVLMDNGGIANGGVDTSLPQSFTITVTSGGPVTSAPVAQADTYTTPVNTALTVAAPGVLANDTGTPAPTAVKASDPSHGTVTLNADGSFTYTPTTNFIGSDSFTYTANNSVGPSAAATVTITVTKALQSLALSCGNASTVPVGGTGQCKVVATYVDGSTQDVTSSATYISDKPGVAAVDSTGKITAGPQAGTVTITVTFGGKQATLVVTVTPPTLTGIIPPGQRPADAGVGSPAAPPAPDSRGTGGQPAPPVAPPTGR